MSRLRWFMSSQCTMGLLFGFMASRPELGRLAGLSQFLQSRALRELPRISASCSAVNLRLRSPVSYQNLHQQSYYIIMTVLGKSPVLFNRFWIQVRLPTVLRSLKAHKKIFKTGPKIPEKRTWVS